jgi:hypothetical protein
MYIDCIELTGETCNQIYQLNVLVLYAEKTSIIRRIVQWIDRLSCSVDCLRAADLENLSLGKGK